MTSYLRGFFIWMIAAFFFLYEFFLRTFVGSVAHQIIPQLHLTVETFALVGSAYYIAYGVMQIPVGLLVDKFGVKRVMLFATLMCVLATFLFSHATNFTTAFLSRFLMGFGSSFAFVCLLVIAVTWFPKKYFGIFAGISQFIGTMGPLLAGGPLISLMLDLHDTWRTALMDIGFFGVILALLVLLFVKNKPRDGERVLIFLKQPETLKVRLMRLMRNKQAWSVAFYSGTLYVSIALLGAIWGTDYLQARCLSQSIAADTISFVWLGYALGCPLLGVLSDLSKRRKPVLLACSVLGLIASIGITYFSFTHVVWVYFVLFFMLGVAAAGQSVAFAAMSEHVDHSTRATGFGLNNGLITLFTATVPLLVSYFINRDSHHHANHLVAHDFIRGFTCMPILFCCSFVIALIFIRETYCKSQKEIIQLARPF